MAEARYAESVEAAHSDQSEAGRIAAALGITAEPLRLDSQTKYAVVARGDASIYLRLPRGGYRENVWDHAAGWLIVTEAGGRVSDVDGQPLDFTTGRRMTANRGIVATAASHPRRGRWRRSARRWRGRPAVIRRVDAGPRQSLEEGAHASFVDRQARHLPARAVAAANERTSAAMRSMSRPSGPRASTSARGHDDAVRDPRQLAGVGRAGNAEADGHGHRADARTSRTKRRTPGASRFRAPVTPASETA